MAADSDPQVAPVDGAGDLRQAELAAAIRAGVPVVLGEQLPAWTPEQGDPPPPELVISADTLRDVLLDRDLSARADPRGLAIQGAIIIGQLDLDRASIGYPLKLISCCFTEALTFDYATLQTLDLNRSHLYGTVRLAGARIVGQLDMTDTTLHNDDSDGFSLIAEYLHADGAVLLDGLTAAGAIHLVGAGITGELRLSAATLRGSTTAGDSLIADFLQVDGNMILTDGFSAAGSVRLIGAHIVGQLNMTGASLHGADIDGGGNCLNAQHLEADGPVFLDDLLTEAGAVRLHSAHLGGQLVMSGAALNGTDVDGDSLVADFLQVGGSALLNQEFYAAGAVRLHGAHVAAQLIMSGATLNGTDADGDSLVADFLRVSGSALLNQGFTAAGAVRLHGAHVAAQLVMIGATLNGTAADGYSFVGDNLQVVSRIFFDDEFTSTGEIGLAGAEIGAISVGETPASLPKLGDVAGWEIRDLDGVVRTDRKAAAAWLDTQPSAQPWQMLATVYERNGQPADARWIRYRSAVRSTGSTKGLTRLSRQIYRSTTGHGYYPLIALLWLAMIFGVAWSLTAVLRDDFTTATTAAISTDLTARAKASATKAENPPIPAPPYAGRVPAAWCTDGWDVTCLKPHTYALTIAFPAAATTEPWIPPDNGWAPTIFYFMRLAAWMFTALLLAGVTGLLRKQT